MLLLQNALHSLKKSKKPQYKFITHLLGLMLMLPGHTTLRRTCQRVFMRSSCV